MVQSCRIEFGAEPNQQACRHADGGVPSGFDFNQYCPAACNASEGGALAQCVAGKAAACEDAGVTNRENAYSSCLSTSGPSATDACLADCDAKRKTCEAGCPQSGFGACMDCAATCGLHAATCWKACPKS